MSNGFSDLGVSPRRRANFVLLGPEISILTFLRNRLATVTIFDVLASAPCTNVALASVGRTIFGPPAPPTPAGAQAFGMSQPFRCKTRMVAAIWGVPLDAFSMQNTNSSCDLGCSCGGLFDAKHKW